MHPDAPSPLRVLIAGGGIAAVEALLALRDLAGERVAATLVAPHDELIYRPLAVSEPFRTGARRRYPLTVVAGDAGASFLRGAAVAVRPETRELVLESGDALAYDALVLALGAVSEPAREGAIPFRGPEDTDAVGAVVRGAAGGELSAVGVVVPSGVAWAVPAYELALQLARLETAAAVHLVTPERAPLELFGRNASDAVDHLLRRHAVRVHLGTAPDADLPAGLDAVIALPRLVGPRVPGLPADDQGFIPVDDHCRVRGVEGVYAVGDATSFPVKQGGLAAQQADTAAGAIAAAAGAPVDPEPFEPVLRGLLLTGSEARWFRTTTASADGAVADAALWWPPAKVAARYLAPYLFGRDVAALRHDASGEESVPVAVPLARLSE